VQASAMLARQEGAEFQTALFKNQKLKKYMSTSGINRLFDIRYHTKNIDKIFKNAGL